MNEELKQKCDALTEKTRALLEEFRTETGFTPVIQTSETYYQAKCGTITDIKVELTLKP